MKRSITKNVKQIIVHRQYDPATFENDLALLQLESPVHYDTHIGKFCTLLELLETLIYACNDKFQFRSAYHRTVLTLLVARQRLLDGDGSNTMVAYPASCKKYR